MSAPLLSRREMLTLSAAGVVGVSCSGWLRALADQLAANPQRGRSCILLWMNGGPSQMDTFDLKPAHANGGPYRERQTTVAGIRISEHLPRLARQMGDMAIVRSMSTREGDHGRGTFLMRTGYAQGPIEYPALGALVSKELGAADAALPNFVSIAPFRQFSPGAYAPGFLGPQYAPLIVADALTPGAGNQANQTAGYENLLRVQDLALPGEVTGAQADARIGLLEQMERAFVANHPGAPPLSHQAAYQRAVRLMRTGARAAFNLDEEPAQLRDAYGRNLFGQGCLLARRLVERGVPFVEVTLGSFDGGALGWDTHQQNFDAVRRLSGILDPAWATLMEDLRARGLLQSTLIVWMGEFGRTPQINPEQGRDHFPNAWSTVLAGGGIRGGQVYGRTSADGMNVDPAAGRSIGVADFLATVCRALGLDPTAQNMSNVGRPIRLTELGARPIEEILA